MTDSSAPDNWQDWAEETNATVKKWTEDFERRLDTFWMEFQAHLQQVQSNFDVVNAGFADIRAEHLAVQQEAERYAEMQERYTSAVEAIAEALKQ